MDDLIRKVDGVMEKHGHTPAPQNDKCLCLVCRNRRKGGDQ